MTALPEIDVFYATFFDRWYSDDDRDRKQLKHTRPDVMQCFVPGTAIEAIGALTEEYRAEAERRVRRMLDTAQNDWPTFLSVAVPVDESWVEAFDAHYTANKVAALIETSDPEDFASDVVVSVCQFGAVLGFVLQSMMPRLEWLWDWPYWESGLYDPSSGSVIPPFHWAMKKFSDYGIDDGFAEKLHCCIHILNEKSAKR